MHPGEIFPISVSPGLIAVDGEREVEIGSNSRASIRLNTNGPWVVDVQKTMALARENGLFCQAS